MKTLKVVLAIIAVALVITIVAILSNGKKVEVPTQPTPANETVTPRVIPITPCGNDCGKGA